MDFGFVPLPQTCYDAMADGARLKGVTCERCGQQYAYLQSRMVVVSKRTLAGLGEDRMRASADAGAQAALQQALDGDTDVAPCPQCGWVQDRMRKDARRKARPIARGLGRALTVVGVGLLVGAAVAIVAGSMAGFALGGLGLFLVIVRLMLWHRAWTNDSGLSPTPADPRSISPHVWTREHLEAAGRENPKVRITDAILDWETHKALTTRRR